MSRRSRGWLAAVLVTAALLPAAPARAAEGSIAQEGFIRSPLLTTRRHLALDATAGRAFDIGEEDGTRVMRVDAYRIRGPVRRIASFTIDDAISGAGGDLSVVDELRHRLYIVYPMKPAGDVTAVLGSPGAEAARLSFGVLAVDTLRARPIGRGSLALMIPTLGQDRAVSNDVGIKAISYFRDGDRDLLYLATEVPAGQNDYSLSNHSVFVHQVDVRRLLDGATNPVDWSHAVPECAKIMARETPGIVFRSVYRPMLVLPCRQGGVQSAGQPLETPGVVRILLSPGATPADTSRFVAEFAAISGTLSAGVVTIDPVRERLFVQIEGSSDEAGLWIFDIASGSWIGLIVLSPQHASGGLLGVGVDPSIGRLYAVSREDPETGFAIVVTASTRSDTVDQGVLTPVRMSSSIKKQLVVVDRVQRRLFVGATDGYLIVRDRIPAPPRTRPADPDESTIDSAEGEDTGVNFVGGAQAYGARLRFIGGLRSVERNANPLFPNGLPQELQPNTAGITPPPPGPGTRDVHFARVLQSTLSNAEASAKATGADRDLENTDADAAGFTNYIRRWGGPDLTGERWPYPTVACTDFGGADDVRGRKAYGAVVACDKAGRSVTAGTVDESLAGGGVVSFASATARTAIVRDRKRGVVVVADAEVNGLVLAGRAGIGRVFTRAETWATGRPAKSNGVGAASRFDREIEHVWVLDGAGNRKVVCEIGCDPKQVRDALNRALGIRTRVEVPDPDPERARGTDGGYEALVVRNPLERSHESSVNEEADERRLEVPALVVTVFSDGRVPSRAVLSFAGVSAESHYGIFLIASGVAFDPPPPFRVPEPGVRVSPTPPSSGPPIPSPSGGPITRIVRTIVDGFRVAFASPGSAARTAAMWLFLASPLLLLLRRRALASRGARDR